MCLQSDTIALQPLYHKQQRSVVRAPGLALPLHGLPMWLDLPHPAFHPPPSSRLLRRFFPQSRKAFIVVMKHLRQTCVPKPCGIITSPDVPDELADNARARLRLQKHDEAHRELDLRRVIKTVENILSRDDVHVVVKAAQRAVGVHDVLRNEVVRGDSGLVSEELVSKREEVRPQIGPINARDRRPVEDQLTQILPEHASDIEELTTLHQAPQNGAIELSAWLRQVRAFDAKVEE